MRDTAGEVGTNSQVTYSCEPHHSDEQRQDDHLEPTFNSSVPKQDIALKTYRKRWTIEKGDGRWSGRYKLMVRPDDDDDDLLFFYQVTKKQPNIQSRDHGFTPTEGTVLPVLFLSHADISSCPLRRRTLSQKLPPLLGY